VPFQAKQRLISVLSDHENNCQRPVNNFCSCILGNQGIGRIFERITEPLTACIGRLPNSPSRPGNTLPGTGL